MRKKTAARLTIYAGREKGRLFLLFLCALTAGVIDIISPYLLGRAVDFYLSDGSVDFSGLAHLLLLLASMLALHTLTSAAVYALSVKTANRIVKRIRADAFEKLTDLPVSYYDSHSHGDVISRFINDADMLAEGLLQGITQLFLGIVTVAGALIFMLRIDGAVTLAVVLVSLLTFAVAASVTVFTGKYFKNQQRLTGSLTGYTQEYVAGAKTVKAFSMEEQVQGEFDEISEQLREAGQKAQFVSSLSNPTTRFVGNLAYISVGLVGGLISQLSAGGISSLILYAAQFERPFNNFTAVTTQILAAAAAARRIFELIDESPQPPDLAEEKLGQAKGEVEFKNVEFSYSKDRPLIKDLSIRVRPGERVAVVGPTGSGKTTLVNLLMRFYDTGAGQILIDGRDIFKCERDDLRRQFSMVLQDTWLFEGTVEENIAYGKPDAAHEEVVAAAKAAGAHGFIKRLEKGYETVISEEGENLSAGERQLLTIARAMLKDAPMLILDEATSNVDTLTESRISKAFLKMMKDKTCFVIAHRLSTIRESDLILIMNEGRVVEQGTHDELMSRNGFYEGLYNSQFTAV
ncbi:MAG TPA: sugar ABC transporter ATP-binding protein [Ruminococcaceae bacterium]|nr:sugar ABC transporter ATP-binding protein [Oscillospiraceae bacterium]